MKQFVPIHKFGIFYDPTTKETCPMNADGTPAASDGEISHIDDMEGDDMGDVKEAIRCAMILWHNSRARREAANIASMHIRASGPVSFANVLAYVREQSVAIDSVDKFYHDGIVAEAITALMRAGRVALYDNGTTFTAA